MAKEKIQVGSKVPDFTLPDQTGKNITLSDILKTHQVVLYFYPKDETPGCTKEACTFRDQYEDFKKAGAEVVGISSDSSDSHKNFAANHKLPFTLLSDEKGEVRKLFGVPTTMGLFPGRVTYVINKQGVVTMVFNSQFNAEKHVSEALKILSK